MLNKLKWYRCFTFFQVHKITVLFKITSILDTSNEVICFWFLFAKCLYLVSVFFVYAKVLNWLSGKSYIIIWVVTFSGHLLEFFSKLPYTHNTVVWHYSWGDMNKCLLTPVREPMISFIGVAYQEHGWGAITQAEITQISASSKSTPSWVTSHRSRKPGAHCSTYRQLNRLKSISSRQLCW